MSEAPEPNIIGNEDSDDDDEIDTKNNETAYSNS